MTGTLTALGRGRLRPAPTTTSPARCWSSGSRCNADIYDSGWAHANLNVIASPLQDVRLVFDLMPTDTDDDWSPIARRMAAVPAALAGYRQSLLPAASAAQVSAVRQVDKCAEQCDTYAGAGRRRASSPVSPRRYPRRSRGRC